MSDIIPIRVRFAPSPTGLLHIGGARTALFNWLFAKAGGGKFILRIEDTDKERSKPEFEEDIKSGLKWLGLDWDEFYRQSERTAIYEHELRRLLDKDRIYHCFCSKEDLEAERQAMFSQGIAPKYSGRCAALDKDEVKKRLEEGAPYVLRFRVPDKIVTFKDLIRGNVKFDVSLLGDMVIARDFNQPLYNFTVVVDDALLNISHVVRGEEHLSNTPKQILIAESLGFNLPQFAHLPMILNPDRSKMSKRFGDTALRDYIKNGYVREAMVNFLSYLGWHPKEDKEVMSADEIIKEFDFKRVQKSGAVFNSDKLDWLNSYYLSKIDTSKFIEAAHEFLPPEWRLNESMVASVKPRMKKLTEIKDLVAFYFELPDYDRELLKWKDMEFSKVAENLNNVLNTINEIPDEQFGKNILEDKIMSIAENGNKGEIFWPLRVALSGQEASPGPGEIMGALYKEESSKRIKLAIKKCEE